MGLSDEHDGIIELAEDTPIGVPAVEAMGLDDAVIDIAITPNRGDCLGVRGIARDLAAAGLGALKPMAVEPVPGTFESPVKVHLEFDGDTAGACPYFVGRAVRGVNNGESPPWLKDLLLAIGLRPISALVDITNFMTIGLNRPLHVFDVDKVKGDLHVRLARPGEKLLALNGKVYGLDGEMCVIADDQHAEALGGVMGGEATGCTGETVNVFLESAYFDPIRTAATGRKLNLTSDARYRFERGIDPAFLVDGMEIATRLVQELCGGEPSKLVIAGAEPPWKRNVDLRVDRVRALGGVDVPVDEIKRILGQLGFIVEGDGGVLKTGVPSWRGDIVGEADLVEEVVRIHGYDRIPPRPLERPTDLPVPALDFVQHRRTLARRALASRGLVEAVTLSFLGKAQAQLFGGGEDELCLVNPISSDLDAMRPSLLPNLIAAAGRNADRGVADSALFEVGPQYAGREPGDQAMVAAGLRSGRDHRRCWSGPVRPVDVFDAKADALGVLAQVGAPVDKIQITAQAPGWYHPGRSGSLTLGPKLVLAHFGEIHPGVQNRMDVKGAQGVPMAGFEVFIDRVPIPKRRRPSARPHLNLPSFHGVKRDFAFVVDQSVTAEAVLRAVRGADKSLIVDATVFDVFAGAALGRGRKSLAVNVVLQPVERTLTDAEIDAIADKVVASVEKATGGVLRT